MPAKKKQKDIPARTLQAYLADTQKRAADFNTEQRIAELEAEVARLRLALEEIRDLDIDLHPMEFANDAGRIAMTALEWTPREERRKIIRKAGAKDRKVLDRLRDHDSKADR